MNVRIATWNINSVRLRLPLVARLNAEYAPDILCLQETKVEDSLFPHAELEAMGFFHRFICGQKGYNGVAILSKMPLRDMHCVPMAKTEHKRHIAATLPSGAELHNFYVPAGGDIPDRELNPAYGFKLDYVDDMREWFTANRTGDRPMILVGDLNIAPLEHDVWSHKQLLGVVSHTPPEVERMEKLMRGCSWVDAARHFIPEPQKLYSWWSYRNRDWKASNRGRRLDHIWLTPPVLPSLAACQTAVAARDWPQPSDHVPVIADFDFPA